MNGDRREFLQTTGLAMLGLSLSETAAAASPPPAMPTERARAWMARLDLKFPIVQSGMGNLAPPALAAAVSNAGGLGSIGLTSARPEEARALVEQTRAATKRLFAVNYILAAHDSSSLSAALEAGAPVVQFSWGFPSPEQLRLISQAGAKWSVQLSCGEAAARAADLGADFVICQGTEAGGHVQALRPLEETLAEVLAAAPALPIIAAGGIADGRAVRQALLAGASGVFLGTRFVATTEAFAHEIYKAALTRAKSTDSVYTICYQDGWVGAPHRALRNSTMRTWEAAGCPAPGQRPGEGDIIGTSYSGSKIRRYTSNPPRPGYSGQIEEMSLWAGAGVGSIRDIAPAQEIVERLWAECLKV
jgi:nitronate monooxygenase